MAVRGIFHGWPSFLGISLLEMSVVGVGGFFRESSCRDHHSNPLGALKRNTMNS